jgi:hypothetical protein
VQDRETLPDNGLRYEVCGGTLLVTPSLTPRHQGLVVEVLSPGTARIDRMIKFSRYAERGISQCWIVDPQVPSVEIFDLVDGSCVLVGKGGRIAARLCDQSQ